MCAGGHHRLPAGSFPGDPCWRCDEEDRALPSNHYRERRFHQLGVRPIRTYAFTMLTGDGQAVTFAIPRALRRRRYTG